MFTPDYSGATVCGSRCRKRIARRCRRARLAAVPREPVRAAVVFERDGWTCQRCGVATPREKRGTRDDDAPELDHRVPLAAGGHHTYANVRCLCRRCNSIKGASAEAA